MNNRDKRSVVLSFCIGDGCLHLIHSHGKEYGALTIDHCNEQEDYQRWKAQILSDALGRTILVRDGHCGASKQISVCMKRFRAWRKFIYPGGRKDKSRILRFITVPRFALAVWLMDDGYVEPSRDARYPGKIYSASLRIFACSQTQEQHAKLMRWLGGTFNVSPRLKEMRRRRDGKTYPFIKFGVADSLHLWSVVREMCLQFASMRHKFRFMETVYQSRRPQPPPSPESTGPNEIVYAAGNGGQREGSLRR